ncbi:MAG: hypothetical protein KGZ83_12440 [Sulfuricella sp.]|nr:hypothetical protein [Sulfuricella sp.]
MPHTLNNQEIVMLRAEVEMLMKERQTLLKVAGAAAVFVAELDPDKLPEDTYDAADMLAESLNNVSEETLRDSLEVVKAEIVQA